MDAPKTAASVAAATVISATIPPRPKAAIRVTRRRFQGAWPLARSPRGARAWVRVRRVSRPLSSRKTSRSGAIPASAGCHAARAAATSGRSCSVARSDFSCAAGRAAAGHGRSPRDCAAARCAPRTARRTRPASHRSVPPPAPAARLPRRPTAPVRGPWAAPRAAPRRGGHRASDRASRGRSGTGGPGRWRRLRLARARAAPGRGGPRSKAGPSPPPSSPRPERAMPARVPPDLSATRCNAMLRRPLAFFLVPLAAATGSAAAQQPQPGSSALPDFRRALDPLLARFVEAYNRKDAAQLAALFTEDAVLVPPGPILAGKRDIAQYYRTRLEHGAMGLRV